jgi:8-oxo-dGTP diphosphatase
MLKWEVPLTVSYHIRVRPTALIIENGSVLLVEYFDHRGIHYFLPGGGAEPGETIKETVKRELLEETMAEVDVGPIAFLYECEPQSRQDDFSPKSHTLFVVFDCGLMNGSKPGMPLHPELNQTDVRWVPLENLQRIKLLPNMAGEILNYAEERRNIELIEDHIEKPRK